MVETNVRQFWGVDTEPVGRARELIELETMLDSAGGGSGSVVVIEGEAGIGKSHLLAAAMRSAERAGFATFHGRAEEFELGRPFGALIDAFDLRSSTPPPESDDLRRLLFADGLGPSIDAQHFRFQIVDAIVDTVEQLSRAGPTALVLDDLQWADPTTLLALGSVARRVGTLPVVVVAATRPYDLTSDLSRLVDRLVGDGHGHLPLDGLDPDAVAEIATQLVGSRPGPRLLEQAARAGGNPFFLIQLLSSLREEGEIVAGDDGTAEYRGEALPRQLRATVERRLGRLSNEAHEVLRVGAVLGSSFPISPVAEVLDTTVLDLINPVQELVASGMLLDQDRTLTFRHDLLRSAVYEAVPSSTRAGLHRAVGRALATTGAPAVEVAEHFLETALPGDALAAEWARQAAGELLTADAGAAVDLLDRALDLCGGVAKCTAAIEVDRARALVWSGRFAEAEVALRATIGHLDDDDELERQSLAALAHVLFEQARWSDLITELGPLVDDPDLPELFADRMRARLASAYAAIHDAEGARKHASAVLESQASSGDPIARCEAYIALSMASGGSEAATTAVAHARRAVAEAARDGTWEAYRRHPHITLAAALKRDDRVEAALTSLEEGRRISGTLMSSWDDSM
ncbi:MAG: AAA family ATPase, partial [Acidimicrobiia bacterium]|nr:AAA family ATPase [Acidimicrobiia bacterium]